MEAAMVVAAREEATAGVVMGVARVGAEKVAERAVEVRAAVMVVVVMVVVTELPAGAYFAIRWNNNRAAGPGVAEEEESSFLGAFAILHGWEVLLNCNLPACRRAWREAYCHHPGKLYWQQKHMLLNTKKRHCPLRMAEDRVAVA